MTTELPEHRVCRQPDDPQLDPNWHFIDPGVVRSIEARVRAQVAERAAEVIEEVGARYGALPFSEFIDTSPAQMLRDCMREVLALGSVSTEDRKDVTDA